MDSSPLVCIGRSQLIGKLFEIESTIGFTSLVAIVTVRFKKLANGFRRGRQLAVALTMHLLPSAKQYQQWKEGCYFETVHEMKSQTFRGSHKDIDILTAYLQDDFDAGLLPGIAWYCEFRTFGWTCHVETQVLAILFQANPIAFSASLDELFD